MTATAAPARPRFRARRLARLLGGTTAALLVAVAAAMAVSPVVVMRGSEVVSAPATTGDVPVVATGALGQATVAWGEHGAKGDIATSTLQGDGSWSTASSIPGSTNGESPVIATSPGGSTVVAWQVEHADANSGAIGVSVRPAGASGFAQAQYLGTIAGPTTNMAPAVAIDDAGDVVVAWEAHPTTGAVSTVQVAFATGTGAFAPPLTVDGASPGGEAHAPSVAVDASGHVILLYTFGSALGQEVRQVLYPVPGVVSGPTTVEGNAENSNAVDNLPQVRSNASGHVVAAWPSLCTPACSSVAQVTGAVGTTTGGVSGGRQVLSDGNLAHASRPRVAIDEAGNATVAWEQSTGSPSSTEVWTAHSGGSTFGPSQLVFGNATTSARELRVDVAGGRELLAWNTKSTDGSQVISMTQAAHPFGNSATYAQPVDVSTAGIAADQGEVVLAPSGTAVVAYRRGADIAVNTNAPTTPVAPITPDDQLVFDVDGDDETPPAPVLPKENSVATVDANGHFTWHVGCPKTEKSCHGNVVFTVRVPVPSHRAGLGRIKLIRGVAVPFRAAGGTSATLKVTLNTASRSALARAGRLKCTATVTTIDAANNRSVRTRTINLVHRRIKLIR